MTEEYIKVIVKFKNVEVASKEDFVNSLGGEIQNVITATNSAVVLMPKDKIGLLKANPDVEYLEVDHEAHILGFASGIEHTALTLVQSIPWGVDKIRAPEVHKTGNKGTGIKVCVIDTGIDKEHPDLKANYKGGYNFIKNNSDPVDDNGHGTHVSGIIAALDNSEGVVGVAPEASIYALKVLDNNGSGSYSNIISALQWCIDNKMQVVNMSFGGSSYSRALEDICIAANNAGILLIAAAGNSGSGTDTIGYPAKFDSVVSVGATDSSDKRASFSSTGPDLEISAPGVSVPSTVPKGTCNFCDPTGYKNLSGTSMACPHVVGTAALVLKSNPDLKNTEIRSAMNSNSLDLGSVGRDTQFGYGRVDAKAAVDNENPPPPPPEKKYRCTGAPLYQCIEDANGPFGSIEECQDACQKPTPETKFNVTVLGSRAKPTGILVLASPRGKYNSEGACTYVCQTLKRMG